MSFPLRDLGKVGVVTDVDPFDLPPTAFTMGVNARFVDNRISDAPTWRNTGTPSNTSPRFALSYSDGLGYRNLFYATYDGHIYRVNPSAVSVITETDFTEATWASTTSEYAYTAASLNNVIYINRPDRVPWYLVKGSSGPFAKLPVWDATWRCVSLRAIGGVLVAINVTKASVQYPQMVKWSDLTVSGATPGDWTASTTNSAGENLLAELPDALVDGWPMRDRMVLYSETECWLMEPSGDSSVFNFRKAFGDAGVINQNCVADVGGVQYVFGPNEIYKHDGVQKVPVSVGIVNKFIYNNLVKANAADCFVIHNPKLSEIMFCYSSVDGYCGFPANGARGCNRAAVYNYRSNTWYFYDLPYVHYMTWAVLNQGDVYDTSTYDYDTVGGTYLSFGDSGQLALYGVCNESSSVPARLRAFELAASTSTNSPVETVANAQVFLERVDFDLDELDVGLNGYKLLRTIYPEGRFEAGGSPMTFSVGIKLYPNEGTQWFSDQTFDGNTLYKLDYNAAGRYLSMKITYPTGKQWSLNGYDFDLKLLSRR